MTVTREELIKIRIELAKQMNQYIINLGDEEIYDAWFEEGIPDGPQEDDYKFFANDDEQWKELCELFGELVKEE